MTNIIIIMVDQMRADVTYHEKYDFVQLPHLDALRQQSVTFDAAFCNYPVCAPSRASVYTGRYPQQTGVLNNRCMLPPDERTMGHHFRDLGYDVVAFGKTHGQNPGFRQVPEPPIEPSLGSRFWGWYAGQSMTEAVAEKSDQPEPILYPYEKPLEEHYDYRIAAQVEDYLATRDLDKPFLLHIGIHTPHTPLIPPENVAGMYADEPVDLDDVSQELADSKPAMQRVTGKEFRKTPRDVREEMIRAYLELNTHVDHVVGRLMAAFRDADVLNDTVIVFVSDHGEQLGEYEMLGKFNNFYDSSMRVPFIVRLPDAKNAGAASLSLVELVDLYPTLCDLANVPKPTLLAGHSFASTLYQPDQDHRKSVFGSLVERSAHSVKVAGSDASFCAGAMIRDERYKLAVYSSDQGELYDLLDDPTERVNLYKHPDYQQIRQGLYEELVRRLISYQRVPSMWGYNQYPG